MSTARMSVTLTVDELRALIREGAREALRDLAPAAAPVAPRYYNVAGAAALIGVSPRTVRGWIAEGTLEASKIGRAHSIEVAAIERMVAAHRRGAPAPDRTARIIAIATGRAAR